MKYLFSCFILVIFLNIVKTKLLKIDKKVSHLNELRCNDFIDRLMLDIRFVNDDLIFHSHVLNKTEKNDKFLLSYKYFPCGNYINTKNTDKDYDTDGGKHDNPRLSKRALKRFVDDSDEDDDDDEEEEQDDEDYETEEKDVKEINEKITVDDCDYRYLTSFGLSGIRVQIVHNSHYKYKFQITSLHNETEMILVVVNHKIQEKNQTLSTNWTTTVPHILYKPKHVCQEMDFRSFDRCDHYQLNVSLNFNESNFYNQNCTFVLVEPTPNNFAKYIYAFVALCLLVTIFMATFKMIYKSIR